MIFINWIIAGLSTGFLLLLAVASAQEKEYRALTLSLIGIPVNLSIWVGLNALNPGRVPFIINVTIFVFLMTFLLISLLKWFPQPNPAPLPSTLEQFDERDHMFSRNFLKFHPELAAQYYEHRQEFKETDEEIHQRREIEEPGNTYYDSLGTPIFDAAFQYLETTIPSSKGEASKHRQPVDPSTITPFIKKIAQYYGAVDVGVTPLKSYHLYSHKGRPKEKWGDKVETPHKNAIAIVVPMDFLMVKQSPSLTIILESSRQYVESAKIANIIAQYIRVLGYDARAHTDANYDVLCVPLAIDAGMGELSRMGILLHPIYGPCIRLSVVTTEMDLTPTPQKKNHHIRDFCNICKKCADNCPSKSISTGEEPTSRGFRHWSIQQQKCYGLWKRVGTDCGFCIRVCPYTKPNTWIHKLVRFYISRNPFNQKIALLMDDLLYGRKIKIPSKNPPDLIV